MSDWAFAIEGGLNEEEPGHPTILVSVRVKICYTKDMALSIPMTQAVSVYIYIYIYTHTLS